MIEPSPKDLARVHAAYWAQLYQIRLANGAIFSTEGREYQVQCMGSRAVEKVQMKATGGGFSEAEILNTIHGMIFGRYPQGVAYYFPTDTDMQDYSKTRFNPLVNDNHEAIGKYLKTGRGRSTDAAGVKRFGTSNLYMRGASLQPTAQGDGVRQSTKTSGIQIDRGVLDEVDQMESEVIAKIRGRMANACVDGVKGAHELVFIGNPSDEDRGVDLLWQESNMMEWFRRCACGGWTCAELEFINDPEKTVGLYSNGKGFIRCVKCGKPVSQRYGQWVPQQPEITNREGIHWSHLTSEYQDPAVILKRYRNPPENNFGDVMRLDLGYAYSSIDEKLTKDAVYACCGNEGMLDSHPGPCAMGVDNDDDKHVVIGIRTGNDTYKVLKQFRCDNFDEVLDHIRRFNVKSCVADLRPNADSARDFQKKARHLGCRTYLCEYTDSPLIDAHFDDKRGIVKVYRTGIFDASHRAVINQNIVLPRRSAGIDNYAKQMCNCVKHKEKDRRSGQVVYRYKKTGTKKDHLRNGTNYFMVSCKKVRKTSTSGHSKKPRKVKHETVKI